MDIKNIFKKKESDLNPRDEGPSYELNLNDEESEMLIKVKAMISDAESSMADKIKHWKDNEKWFNGEQWKNERQEYQSDTVINRIFPAVRNMVGLATDSRPSVDILPAPAETTEQADVNKQKAKKLSQLFEQRWDEIQMSVKGTKALYQAFIYDDAYLMPFWNYMDNDIDVEIINPKNLLVDPTATSVDDAQYVAVKADKNRKWIQDNYPDKVNSVKFGVSREVTTGYDVQSGIKDQTTVYFVMTDEIRIVATKDTILEAGANPFYEFRDEQTQLQDWLKAGNGQESFVKLTNYFTRPQKPLIPIPTYNIGEFYSKSIMNQLKPVQKTIDKRKQQIDENANTTANPQWIYDTDVIESEKADLITNEPGLLIGVPGGPNSIKKEPGADMPSYVLSDLSHSETTFDNIMGHHDISRGSKSKTQTATEAGILSEADQTPVRLIVRNYEQSLVKMYQWWLQLASLFYTEDHYVRVWGISGVKDFVTVNRNDVSDGINIVIRPGSTLPTDKRTMRSDAVQLAQMGLIDPLSLYEILEFPDPVKSSIRLLNWKNGIISDTLQPPAPAPGQPTAVAGQNPGQEDVDWAIAEEARIAQGETPKLRPEMITQNHIAHHQAVLDGGQYPQPKLLQQMIEAETMVLSQQQGSQGGQGAV
jgi:hypothetical protein